MIADIRKILQDAKGPSRELNNVIAEALSYEGPQVDLCTNHDFAIAYLQVKECDWVMGNVNGYIGGTPFAYVGAPEDKASYSATPLLSLWLSYFRLELGDERDSINRET